MIVLHAEQSAEDAAKLLVDEPVQQCRAAQPAHLDVVAAGGVRGDDAHAEEDDGLDQRLVRLRRVGRLVGRRRRGAAAEERGGARRRQRLGARAVEAAAVHDELCAQLQQRRGHCMHQHRRRRGQGSPPEAPHARRGPRGQADFVLQEPRADFGGPQGAAAGRGRFGAELPGGHRRGQRRFRRHIRRDGEAAAHKLRELQVVAEHLPRFARVSAAVARAAGGDVALAHAHARGRIVAQAVQNRCALTRNVSRREAP
mmetsp:Transcript_15210/g.40130  ORF Transcript_15210/g.40130 Transcript_15210/m.40130 type:complete len:256 (-) Transcript_15210:221-988(-)